MITVLIQMGFLIACGAAFRGLRPGGIDPDALRQALTSAVYYLFLPAMVLSVLGRAELGMESLRIATFGIGTILIGMILAPVLCRSWRISRRRMGAALLAAAFGNITFLGLPLLEQTFGVWTQAVVLQFDYFASSPLLYTLGTVAARRYGHDPHRSVSRWSDWANPPLLSAVIAVVITFSGISLPDWLQRGLELLASAVVPLMLVSLGLGLRGHFDGQHYWITAVAVVLCKLIIVPFCAVALGLELGFSGDMLSVLVLESAMPCMAMGVMFCDRYRLDTAFYSMVTLLTTLLSLLTLPLWHQWHAGLAFVRAFIG